MPTLEEAYKASVPFSTVKDALARKGYRNIQRKSSASARKKKEAAQDAFIEALYALPLSSFGHVRSEEVYTLVKSIKPSENPRYNNAALVARFKAGGRSVRFLLGISKGEDVGTVRPLLKGFKPVKKSSLRFSDSRLNPPSSHVWSKVVRVKVPPLESEEDVAPLVEFVKDKVLPTLTDLTEWRHLSGLEEAKSPQFRAAKVKKISSMYDKLEAQLKKAHSLLKKGELGRANFVIQWQIEPYFENVVQRALNEIAPEKARLTPQQLAELRRYKGLWSLFSEYREAAWRIAMSTDDMDDKVPAADMQKGWRGKYLKGLSTKPLSYEDFKKREAALEARRKAQTAEALLYVKKMKKRLRSGIRLKGGKSSAAAYRKTVRKNLKRQGEHAHRFLDLMENTMHPGLKKKAASDTLMQMARQAITLVESRSRLRALEGRLGLHRRDAFGTTALPTSLQQEPEMLKELYRELHRRGAVPPAEGMTLQMMAEHVWQHYNSKLVWF